MIPKPQAYVLIKDAYHPPHPLEWVPKGTVVYEFNGNDFGCVRDDWNYTRLRTRACTLDPDGIANPFFTVPVADLQPLSCTV